MQLLDNIERFARDLADRPAIRGSGSQAQTLSYARLSAQIRQGSHFLRAHAGQASCLFIIANRSVELVSAILSGLTAGYPVAIIDPRLGDYRISQILELAGPAYGLVDSLGQTILARLPGHHEHANLDSVFCDMPGTDRGGITSTAVDSDAAIILFTSGSTGQPKGVQISRSDLNQRLATEVEWFGLSQHDRILGVLPLSFDVGLTQLLGTLYCGGQHILLGSWLPQDVLRNITEHGAHGLALSPVVWRQLLSVQNADSVWETLDSLRYITLSGGTLPEQDLRNIMARLTQCGLIKTYGQTEMFRISSVKLQAHPDKLLSVGRAYPGVTIDIQDDEGQPCPANVVGEIIAQGMGRMIGYLGAQSATKSDKPPVIRTGDLGYLDEEGFLHIKSRRDEMIKILDQRIYPDDVAQSIRAILGDSGEVAVIVQQSDQGPFLAAFITGHGAENSQDDRKQITTLLRQHLASHLIPRQILLRASLPHTVTGKIDKVKLREELSASVETSSLATLLPSSAATT